MLFTLVKALVSALVILFVTWLANRSPTFGGWIAALPLVSLLSAFSLSVGQQSSRQIADFLTGVLWGLIPTAFLLKKASQLVHAFLMEIPTCYSKASELLRKGCLVPVLICFKNVDV